MIEQGRVFFVGAGFSAGAQVPLTDALLPRAAELFRDEAPGLFTRVSWWAENADVDLNGSPDAAALSRLCTQLDFMELREHGGGERWSDEGSRERLALKFYLAKAIALSTPPIESVPEFYLEFAGRLRPDDVVVSFNWDTLVENLLDRVGVPFSYTGSKDHVLLLKLHGSINWRVKRQRFLRREAADYEYRPVGDVHLQDWVPLQQSDRLWNADAWREAQSLVDAVSPLLVLPGYGKTVDVRLLSPFWYRPESLNLRKGGVSIIGLSVAEDDFIVAGLLRYLLRSAFDEETLVRVINPDGRVRATFDRIAGGSGRVQFIEQRFDSETVPTALFEDVAAVAR